MPVNNPTQNPGNPPGPRKRIQGTILRNPLELNQPRFQPPWKKKPVQVIRINIKEGEQEDRPKEANVILNRGNKNSGLASTPSGRRAFGIPQILPSLYLCLRCRKQYPSDEVVWDALNHARCPNCKSPISRTR